MYLYLIPFRGDCKHTISKGEAADVPLTISGLFAFLIVPLFIIVRVLMVVPFLIIPPFFLMVVPFFVVPIAGAFVLIDVNRL